MPAVCRVGDQNTQKGRILEGVGSVLVNNKPIAVVGKKISPHGKGKHACASVQQGNSSVLAEGQAVTFVGAMDDCMDAHTSGSGDVNVG
jgi:uncharacterized Zn-binding protein involved in type VI secretion